jgi:hypothetical protein
MTNSATPKLLSLIRKIREERRSGDLTRLTDAELVAKLARALSDDKGEERLIACAMAVQQMAAHARRDQRDGDLERASATSSCGRACVERAADTLHRARIDAEPCRDLADAVAGILSSL